MAPLTISRLRNVDVPVATAWLLADCMEARGKQDLWVRQKPAVLDVLREQAVIQSVESSNRIEGVTVAQDRLRPVVVGKAKPRDRSEEELAGYRKALDWIFSQKTAVSVEPGVILRLHSMAQGGFSGDAGKWKERNNEIVEFNARGERRVRFIPASAKETPRLIHRLCTEYTTAIEEKSAPPLLVIATAVFDFLCIHPFRDGNGRVSRLLTTLLLQQQGFIIARYVSLERLIEETKDRYYEVLAECSLNWHQGRNEIVPWWNYLLTIIRRGYQEFERHVETTQAPAKTDIIRETVMSQTAPFTLADIAAQCPSVSPQMIKKVLADLKQQGLVQLTGRGRGARWSAI
ncbi:MAG TPA: Fic family protein [Candidatus Bathyarchaeia archaeon]|nr:Fic family protein [Candidatus Bathyarchaeia archaeon]